MIVEEMFPELEDSMRNKVVGALQKSKSSDEVKQLLNDVDGLVRTQQGNIEPRGFAASFKDSPVRESKGIINTPDVYKELSSPSVVNQVPDEILPPLKGQGYGGFASRILAGKGSTSSGGGLEPQQEDMSLADTGQEENAFGAQPETAQMSEDTSPFSPANVEANVQKIIAQGGDFKDVSQYLGIVETMQKMGGSGQKPLNSTSAGIITDMQNGLANLGALSDEFGDSGANVPVVGELLAKIPGNTSAKNLQADVARIKQIIGKALEGGVLRKEDEEKYAKILPTLNDPDDQAQYKIKQIAGDLQRKLVLYQQNLGGGGGGMDMSSLVAQ
jgi:hypothetical protein